MRYDWDTREAYWVKDLKKIRRRGYPLERVIVVDDTSRKHERNYGNLVHVQEFTGSTQDDELLHLGRYLVSLSTAPNVRGVEKRDWRRRLLAGESSP